MSEARSGRFEIDLDEIEKQLRRSVESAPPPRNDPLAELARIVGQDDPFRGLFAERNPAAGAGAPAVAAPAPRETRVPGPDAAEAAELTARRNEEDAILHGRPADDVFDPVTDAYGSLDNALDQEDFRPLQPRRSRKRLLAVGGLVVAAVVATAGGLAYRNGAKLGLGSGLPPVIKADNAPLKVAPENPGGMEIPNQNRQIYERAAPEAQTRVVDAREQPVDVREAARNLPPAAPIGDPAQPVAPAAPATPVPAETARPATAPPEAGRSTRPSAVASALGEPRRVRTVAVRPDGTLFDGPPSSVPVQAPSLVPAPSSLPPPVQVATIPISLGQSPAATPQATAPASDPSQGGTPSGPAVAVLPPQRPRPAGTPAATTPTNGRVAALPTDTTGDAAPAGTSRAFTVQLGIRPSEAEARTASTQLAAKFAGDLGGRTPAVARAEVNGKTVYRMRVGPMSRDDANALCNRLKGSGGQCFIASN